MNRQVERERNLKGQQKEYPYEHFIYTNAARANKPIMLHNVILSPIKYKGHIQDYGRYLIVCAVSH
jgi:hypothetical protein